MRFPPNNNLVPTFNELRYLTTSFRDFGEFSFTRIGKPNQDGSEFLAGLGREKYSPPVRRSYHGNFQKSG